MPPTTEAPLPAARARAGDRMRRRLATGAAAAAAGLFAYYAVWGHNGILGYATKRSEDRVLAAEIKKLGEENARLKDHVDHLQSDPASIEHEAREQLHYARPGEVIYTLGDAPTQSQAPSPSGGAHPAARR